MKQWIAYLHISIQTRIFPLLGQCYLFIHKLLQIYAKDSALTDWMDEA